MKILMVNKFLYPNGGSETYIFQLGKELERQGHQVEYFGMEHEGRIVGNHAECYTSGMDFHTGKLQKLLYPFKILYSGEAKRKMLRVLEDFQPDVVHLNNFNFQLTPSVIYAVKKYEKKHGIRVKLVYTAHDYQWVCPNHMMRIPATGELCQACIEEGFGQCTKQRCIHNSKIKSVLGTVEATLYKCLKTYSYVDVIICPSNFLKKKLDTYEGLCNKTLVLHNFIQIKKEENLAQKEPYVLYFGRYSEEKGVHTLLEVCRELEEIPFIFAGSGELEEEINAIPNIKNVGFLRGNALTDLIEHAQFSVFPSEWYENCPFTVMESQAYGTPVIASDLGGTPELLENERTGLLFEGGNRERLKEAISTLWREKKTCEQYQKNCVNLAFDTVEDYCIKLLKIYSQELS